MAGSPFDWRPARPDDVPALAAIYGDAARRLGLLVYTADQVRAWASFAADDDGFRRYVVDHDTWVAEGGRRRGLLRRRRARRAA